VIFPPEALKRPTADFMLPLLSSPSRPKTKLLPLMVLAAKALAVAR
jgi:hypothetical protein